MPKNAHMARMNRDILKKQTLRIPVAPAHGVLGPDTESAIAERLRAALIRRPRNPDFGPVPGASVELQASKPYLSGAGCTYEVGPHLSAFVAVSQVQHLKRNITCNANQLHSAWGSRCRKHPKPYIRGPSQDVCLQFRQS
jgi:hypothetical protein